MTDEEYIDQIVDFYGNRFRVFPLNLALTPLRNGFLDTATKDPEGIRKLWAGSPRSALGIATGDGSGVWVLDEDVKNGLNGVKIVEEWEELEGSIPRKFGQTTPRGGRHTFFTKTSYCWFKNITDALKFDERKRTGVDVRTNRGFVKAWPTKGYVRFGSISNIVPAPSWLVEELNNKRTETGSKRDLESEKQMDEEELDSYLQSLDPLEYQDRSSWVRLMAATHAASGGHDYGMRAFIEFSSRDTQTRFSEDPTEYIEKTWPTLDCDRDTGVSAGTLVYEARQAQITREAAMFDENDDEEEAKPKPKENSKFVTKVDSEKGVVSVWQTKLDKEGYTLLMATEGNVSQFFQQTHLPQLVVKGNKPVRNPLCGLVAFDELACAIVFTRKPPFAVIGRDVGDYRNVALQREDFSELRTYMLSRYKVNISEPIMEGGVRMAAMREKFNPFLRYLESLDWDKTERLETWLIDTAGVKDSIYNRAVSKKMLMCVAARSLKPGCKVDTIPILMGTQGQFKSTMLEELCPKFYSNPRIDLRDKDCEQNLKGAVIVELQEGAKLLKKVDELKAFASTKVAKFRGSFAKSATDWPRTCVIFLTLNPEDEILYDTTGNRRFWPVDIRGKINIEALKKMRDQLWAEVFYRVKQKEKWWLTDEEEELQKYETAKLVVQDPWKAIIVDYLYQGSGKDLEYVGVGHIVEEVIQVETSNSNKSHTMKVGSILKQIGWVRKRLTEGDRRPWVYIRPKNDKTPE